MFVTTECVLCLLWLGFGFASDSDSGEDDVNEIIGESMDIFANFGELSQMMQVISGDFDEEYSALFTEKTIQVFDNSKAKFEVTDEFDSSISFRFCDTFDDLMDNYYDNFKIQGADKPWKSFMGDWHQEEILRSMGLSYDINIALDGYCCFVLTRISKVHSTVSLVGSSKNYTINDQLRRAVRRLNSSDEVLIRKFMRSYGTHYINSFSTGNSVYQVFVYTKRSYNLLKKQMKHRRSAQLTTDDLRFFTSSFFLRQIGEVMVASGNKTTERWCDENLRDGHFLYTRATLLKLYDNTTLLRRMTRKLDNGALVHINLKTLTPVFKNDTMRRKFREIVDNDLKLWEVSV